MNVLLIDLGSNRTELNEPIGIESIAGNLLHNIEGIQVHFKWGLIDSLDISSSKNDYDFFGISAKLGTYNNLKRILSLLREERKKCRVIVGGPLATFGYMELLKEFEDIICVRGEGESTFSKICTNILDTSSFNLGDIPNIVYKKNNCIVETKRTVENLNTIRKPYRHYLNNIIDKEGIVRIESSRGCSWSKCDFCSVYEHYGCSNWRPFPLEYIIEELETLSNSGCLSPYFTDEDFFGGDYERSRQLAEIILKKKNENRINPKMNFFFSARINDILHEHGVELLKLWKIAGLRELFVGLESGVQKQLKRYGKASTPKRNAKVIQLLKNLDIQLDVGYILFDPEMSFDELIENIQYIELENLSRHDSRSLKYIRAQPFTATSKNYFHKNIINGGLNIDLLYYPLKYNDERVFNVMNQYYSWEAKLKDITYIIQAKSRGEIFSEEYRVYLKEQLSAIRELDFIVLKKIVDFVLNRISEKELMTFQNSVEMQKNEVIENIDIK
ncbi:MAG: cobalamin-dependent protein [Ignavibacteria bacterium]|nr:cobalamin-dependent protein [Ignavibacteria bacterium]